MRREFKKNKPVYRTIFFKEGLSMQNARMRDLEFKAVKKARLEEREKLSELHNKIIEKIDRAIVIAEGKQAFIN